MARDGLASGLIALAGLALLAAGCVCPPRPAAVADAGFRTPQQTFESFQTYLAADLVDWEYRCFSASFRSRHGVSLATYAEFRDELFRENPWLKLFAKAKVVRDWPEGEGFHGIEASVAGRTVHVRLVREDSFEIYSGGELVADGYTSFGDLVEVESGPRGHRVTAVLPVEDPWGDLEAATAVVVERTWKIDDLTEAPASPE